MQNAADLLRQALRRGESLEGALSALRLHAVTPVEAIKAIHEVQKVGLGEAKEVFSSSPAWRAENEAADRMHAEILAELGREQEP
ncbi:hypothetical protein [Roseateles microcysteis]|uniref:hypothetical protein n=1 Tax=Roseateles microcysteis TaxID=3119057 RepID=UPI002FE50880